MCMLGVRIRAGRSVQAVCPVKLRPGKSPPALAPTKPLTSVSGRGSFFFFFFFFFSTFENLEIWDFSCLPLQFIERFRCSLLSDVVFRSLGKWRGNASHSLPPWQFCPLFSIFLVRKSLRNTSIWWGFLRINERKSFEVSGVFRTFFGKDIMRVQKGVNGGGSYWCPFDQYNQGRVKARRGWGHYACAKRSQWGGGSYWCPFDQYNQGRVKARRGWGHYACAKRSQWGGGGSYWCPFDQYNQGRVKVGGGAEG